MNQLAGKYISIQAILLFLLLALFCAEKFNDLSLPYFWDELGVYAQCAVAQYHHGISFMPASLDPELSRGHPLLLTVLNASVMKIFGTSVVVPHVFHLAISLTLLLAMYYYIAKHFSSTAAIVSVALLMAQPIFLAQSVLLLPEVLLSLLLFLALVNYHQQNFFLYALFGSLAILTKESAIVLPLTVFAYSLWKWFFNGNGEQLFSWRHLFFVLTPCFVFALFLLVQKLQMGWYFFPYHGSSIEFSLPLFAHKFGEFMDVLFWNQGRYWWKNILLVSLGFALLTNRINRQSISNGLIPVFVFFIAAMLAFSSLSFYGERYVLPALVVFSMVTGVALTTLCRRVIVIVPVVFFICAVSYCSPDYNGFNYDNDLGYRKQVSTLQKAVAYFENSTTGPVNVYGNFPAYFALRFAESGYLKDNSKVALPIRSDFDEGYFISANPGAVSYLNLDKYDAQQVAVFTDGYARAEVYRVKLKQGYSSNP